jgi:hypothetical protein
VEGEKGEEGGMRRVQQEVNMIKVHYTHVRKYNESSYFGQLVDANKE